MPILPAEASFYPETLFAEKGIDVGDRRWRVMHTRPRQEKALARDLLARRVAFFLPLMTKAGRARGKATPSYVPLFPGYLFALAGRNEWGHPLATRRVARSLDVPHQDQFWRDLRQIQQLIASGLPIQSEPVLEAGSPVEICAGPLMGLRGIVIKAAAGERFVVKVNFIERGASILIDRAMLEKVSA
jgi:transcription antitermination factor NusG